MDKLERLGELNGYQRVTVDVERAEDGRREVITVQTYVKPPDQITSETQRIGPILEYTAEHAAGFEW